MEKAKSIGSMCMGLHVRRAARRLTRIYDDALMPLNLTIGQFSTLTILATQDSWSMQPLADMLGTDRSSLTAGLKPLERRSLVASTVDPSDRRIRHVAITPEGAALLEQAEPLWQTAQNIAQQRLGENVGSAIRLAAQRLA